MPILPSYFYYFFVHVRQKVRLRPELSPTFLSTLSPNPTRKARPDLQLCRIEVNFLYQTIALYSNHKIWCIFGLLLAILQHQNNQYNYYSTIIIIVSFMLLYNVNYFNDAFIAPKSYSTRHVQISARIVPYILSILSPNTARLTTLVCKTYSTESSEMKKNQQFLRTHQSSRINID